MADQKNISKVVKVFIFKQSKHKRWVCNF